MPICGAERIVHLRGTPSTDGPADQWIVLVEADGKTFFSGQPRSTALYLGCSGPATLEKIIQRCSRCTRGPDRRCDLTWRVTDQLEPQTS